MSFMIAEILGLLALAALCGGGFVYWATRRHFVDVSSEYERYEDTMREATELRTYKVSAEARIAAAESTNVELERRLTDEFTQREALQTKLGSLEEAIGKIRPTDLSRLEGQMVALDRSVSSIQPVDIEPLQNGLAEIKRSVAKLENTDVSDLVTGVAATTAAIAALKPTNLDPVTSRLESIEERLTVTSAAVEALAPTDLTPVTKTLGVLDARVATTSQAVAALRSPDLAPVTTTLKTIEERVAALRNTDVTAVDARVQSLTASVERLEQRMKPQPVTDLSGVHRRLDSIAKTLEKRPASPVAPAAKVAPRPRPSVTPKPRRPEAGALLKSASFGKPDDLKRISGVGPKLEKMLNDIGVYYFFQVRSWEKTDIQRVDDLLKVFKGRIERDDWVTQARSLAHQSGAARMD